MATDDSKYISFLKVKGTENFWAYYDYRVDEDVTSGDPWARISTIAQSMQLPTGGGAPVRHTDGDRFLDIRESRSRGHCTYAFQLDAELDGNQRLKFATGRPFIPLPLNSGGNDDFLTDFHMEYGNEGLWASFSCNLGVVQDSPLAARIKAEAAEHGETPILSIPFCLNVIDPELQASPWAVPREQPHVAPKIFDFFTHGGVHPSDVAFLNVEL